MSFCAILLQSYSAGMYFESNLPFIENSITPWQKHDVNIDLLSDTVRFYRGITIILCVLIVLLMILLNFCDC